MKEVNPWKDFIVGLIIMAAVIIFAFWITRHDSTATDSGQCNATQNYAQGC